MKLENATMETILSEGKPILIETFPIKNIQRYFTRKGYEVIRLLGQNGEVYSSFGNVWRDQKIDLESLREGDLLTVHFYENGKYRNFTKVELVSGAK